MRSGPPLRVFVLVAGVCLARSLPAPAADAATQPAATRPAAPDGFFCVADGDSAVELFWIRPGGRRQAYNVYRGEAPGVRAEPRRRIASALVQNAFVDRAVRPGRTYYYVVTVVVDGVQSEPSLEDSTTTSRAARPATRPAA